MMPAATLATVYQVLTTCQAHANQSDLTEPCSSREGYRQGGLGSAPASRTVRPPCWGVCAQALASEASQAQFRS